MTALRIDNRTARWLWIDAVRLASAPTGALDIISIIHKLGFVQLDTIQAVARAHHHIIWSRNQNYREPMLNNLLADTREIFEHYTHDASVIPMAFYPMWRRQFRRKIEEFDRLNYFKVRLDNAGQQAFRARIANEGPLSTHAFESSFKGERKIWSRPPHKTTLDYMWYAGELATSHRDGIIKYYDLAENVIPADLLETHISDADQIDWLCRSALERIAIGSFGEIQKFWEATSAKETRDWAKNQNLTPVEIEGHDGTWTKAVALPDIEARIARMNKPTARLRILNPFDPAVRDRKRLERLFGFEYRIEIFVPAAKRKWGYYVFPILEGDRFVGRIEVKADRANDALNVLNVWQEPKVKWTPDRRRKIDAELDRLARFIGVSLINWQCPH